MDDESVEKSEYIGTVALAIKEVIEILSSSQIPRHDFSHTFIKEIEDSNTSCNYTLFQSVYLVWVSDESGCWTRH